MTGLFDRYAARKRKRQVSSSVESDAALAGPSQPAADDQPTTDESSGDQAIFIPSSPELGLSDQTEPDRVAQSEPNEGDPAPIALQILLPFDRAKGQASRSEYMRSGLPRPHWLVSAITNNYLPPRGPEPLRVEVSTPGAKEVKDILHRWESFHHEVSVANRLGNLYPHMYWWWPLEVWAFTRIIR